MSPLFRIAVVYVKAKTNLWCTSGWHMSFTNFVHISWLNSENEVGNLQFSYGSLPKSHPLLNGKRI